MLTLSVAVFLGLVMLVFVPEAMVEQSVRETHGLLAELMKHEHASLALAQRCSSLPAQTPLFTALLNYRHGAEEAARSLNVELIWDGPTSLDASQQNELVEVWITRGVDAIVVAVENKGSISTVLRKARQHGIAVLTWDSDAEPDSRDFFLNQATPEGIANTLTDEAAHLLPDGGPGVPPSPAVVQLIQTDMLAFVSCMRSHGVRDWPDPTLDRGRAIFDPQAVGIASG